MLQACDKALWAVWAKKDKELIHLGQAKIWNKPELWYKPPSGSAIAQNATRNKLMKETTLHDFE